MQARVADSRSAGACWGGRSSRLGRYVSLSRLSFFGLISTLTVRLEQPAWTYLFVSYLPHAVIDVCLGVQDRLYGIYFNHVRELVTSRRGRAIDSAQPGPSTRGPLPTPPASRGGPFRPGPAQVPLADPFMPTPSPAPSSSRGGGGAGGGGYSSCDEASSQSSTEDFGPLGGSGYVSGSASMGGSFVSVGRDEAE